MEGLILRGIGGFYTVLGDEDRQKYTLRAQAKLRRARVTPCVGDRVVFTPGANDEEEGWLEQVLPRRNALVRPPVANVDFLVLVVPAASPQPDLLLIDRLMLLCRMTGISPMVAVNKADLNAEAARELAAQYENSGAPVYPVSAHTGLGIEALRSALRGRVHAFAGQSGVGKSTLINALYALNLTTGAVSGRIERGRHTTRHCELIAVDGGGMVLDTPGFSLLELKVMDPIELQNYYAEFEGLTTMCRFSPCAHVSEPDCAVRRAVEDGRINPQRYERYKLLFEEMSKRWRERYD